MKYNFSKKQVIKNSMLAFVYSFIITLFVIAIISNLYTNVWLEILASLTISLSVAVVFSLINYISYLSKTFTIDKEGITFYIKEKPVKTILFKNLIETNIAKSFLYGNNRVVSLITEKENISFSVNYKVYQHIRGFFPIFNDRKDESLIRFNNKYKIKTLLLQYCIISFYFATACMVISTIVVGLLKRYSVFYKEAIRLYFIVCIAFFCLIFLGYTIYFFYKFFAYGRHSLRFDGTLKLEYYRFNKQKCNYEIKNVIGVKHVKNIFSFLFNLEQIYIIYKNDRDIVQNHFVPFCLTSQDVAKLKLALFDEQEKLEKISKKSIFYSVFPFVLTSVGLVVLSILFTPWLLMFFCLIIPCFIANFKTRSSYVGDKIISLSNGVLAKRIYTFKTKDIKAITITDRFFETKSPYAAYEILIEGYSGVYVMGVFDRDLEQKIVEKIKVN